MTLETVRVRIWDLPVRLFHWTLVLLIAFSWFTGEQGSDWLPWHFLSGYAILTLLLFRLAWGFFGSTYARFAHFLRGPQAILAYLRRPGTVFGHNPVGGLMILALLVLLFVQVGTGLFADDDIMTQGPFGGWVSGRTRELLTTIHRINVNVILALIAVHVLAAFYYLTMKRENLIGAMIRGWRAMPARDPAAVRFAPPLLALALLAAAALAVWGLVYLGWAVGGGD